MIRSEELIQTKKLLRLTEIEAEKYTRYPDQALEYALMKTRRKVGLKAPQSYFDRVIDQYCMLKGILLPYPKSEMSDLFPRMPINKFLPSRDQEEEGTPRTGNAQIDEANAQKRVEAELGKRRSGDYKYADRSWMDTTPEDPVYTIERWEESLKSEAYKKAAKLIEPLGLLRIARIIIHEELPTELVQRLFVTYPKLHKEVLATMNYKQSPA